MRTESAFEVEEVEVELYALRDETVPSARRFVVRVDETKAEFPDPSPTGLELLRVVGKRPCSHVLVQVIRHADDQFIDPDEHVDLRKPGVERFITVVRDIVTINVDEHPFEVARGPISVSDIKRLAGIPDGYRLAQDVDGCLVPLPEEDPVEVQGCEVFESRPPAGGAS